jgi:hypothetical protein
LYYDNSTSRVSEIFDVSRAEIQPAKASRGLEPTFPIADAAWPNSANILMTQSQYFSTVEN